MADNHNDGLAGDDATAGAGAVAIIAGNGRLPVELAHGLVAKGERVLILGISDEAEPELKKYPYEPIVWGKVGVLFRQLKEHNVDRLVMAGGVVGRPFPRVLDIDFDGWVTLPRVVSVLVGGGDNALLTGFIEVFEERGFKVCGASQLLPEFLVKPGPNGQFKPDKKDRARMIQGAAVTKRLGPFDIGQACVVIGKRAVAVEGVEGTDEMLSRIAYLRSINRLPHKKGGVLVKCAKDGQDERADLPAIGPQTIENVHRAQLNGIGLEAGKTLILDRENTLALADKLGVYVYGMELSAQDIAGVSKGAHA
ncbi:MAG: UDP-2,3-diacylglucosamine diphosphatase LpxI [Pseudomonadota bacterium]